MKPHDEVNDFMLKHFDDDKSCIAIKRGVYKILKKYWIWLNICPPSLSGKFHKEEATMLIHIERALQFAHHIIDEFQITDPDKTILLAGVALHDIGKAKLSSNDVEKCKDNPEWSLCKTGWYRKKVCGSVHMALGAVVIMEDAFEGCQEVINLVETHGSHWYKHTRRPYTFLEKMCALCDYLASREKFGTNAL